MQVLGFKKIRDEAKIIFLIQALKIQADFGRSEYIKPA